MAFAKNATRDIDNVFQVHQEPLEQLDVYVRRNDLKIQWHRTASWQKGRKNGEGKPTEMRTISAALSWGHEPDVIVAIGSGETFAGAKIHAATVFMQQTPLLGGSDAASAPLSCRNLHPRTSSAQRRDDGHITLAEWEHKFGNSKKSIDAFHSLDTSNNNKISFDELSRKDWHTVNLKVTALFDNAGRKMLARAVEGAIGWEQDEQQRSVYRHSLQSIMESESSSMPFPQLLELLRAIFFTTYKPGLVESGFWLDFPNLDPNEFAKSKYGEVTTETEYHSHKEGDYYCLETGCYGGS